MVPFSASLGGAQITSVGSSRADLAGPVTWAAAGAPVAADLRGTVFVDRPEGDGAPPPDGAGAPPAAPSGPSRFTGELAVAVADGRTYVLVLTGGSLDRAGTGTAMTAGFELRDRCGHVVAEGTARGDLSLREAPVPSSVALVLAGQGTSEAPACG
jgi:hypothetical protein